jgi:hypothetical protein
VSGIGYQVSGSGRKSISRLDFAQGRFVGDDKQKGNDSSKRQRLLNDCQVLLLIGFGLRWVFGSFFGFGCCRGCGAFGFGGCFFGALLGVMHGLLYRV